MFFLIIMLIIGLWWWKSSRRIKQFVARVQDQSSFQTKQQTTHHENVFDGEFEEIKSNHRQ